MRRNIYKISQTFCFSKIKFHKLVKLIRQVIDHYKNITQTNSSHHLMHCSFKLHQWKKNKENFFVRRAIDHHQDVSPSSASMLAYPKNKKQTEDICTMHQTYKNHLLRKSFSFTVKEKTRKSSSLLFSYRVIIT